MKLLSLIIEIKNLESLGCKMNGTVFQIPGTVLNRPIALKVDTDHLLIRLVPVTPQYRVRVSIVVHALISVPRESHLRGSGALTSLSSTFPLRPGRRYPLILFVDCCRAVLDQSQSSILLIYTTFHITRVWTISAARFQSS